MNRIIRNVSPSYPWMWMAILSSTPNSMNPANSDDAGKGLVKAAKTVAKIADFGTKLLNGDMSAFLPMLTGVFGDDMLFSSLIKSVDLPNFGFTMEYSDLGFVRYPHASQVLTEGFTLDFLETQDNVVSRYMLDWQNQVCPSVGKVNTGSKQGDMLANDNDNIAAFKPLTAVARTLYVIKLRRSTLLALANLLVEAGNDALKGIWNVQTGMYETPVQIYSFPQVFPQSFKEAKLDKSEVNSIRTVSVRMDRIPILRYAADTGSALQDDFSRVTQEAVFLSGVLGASRAIDSLTDAAIGLVTAGGAAIGTARAVYGLYTAEKAKDIVNLSSQPETFDEYEEIEVEEEV